MTLDILQTHTWIDNDFIEVLDQQCLGEDRQRMEWGLLLARVESLAEQRPCVSMLAQPAESLCLISFDRECDHRSCRSNCQ